MNQFMIKSVSGTEGTGKPESRRTEASIWKEAIEALIDPTTGMDETEQKNYENKILQKMKTGKRLTSEELDYLRLHNPDLYRSAMRVEKARESLRTRLSNCKSKEEVQQVISGQMEMLQAMKNDKDIEYMTAMVKREVESFKKSSAYARLPLKREEGKKKEKCPEENPWKEEAEKETFGRVAVYSRMQVQCETITQMAQGFL